MQKGTIILGESGSEVFYASQFLSNEGNLVYVQAFDITGYFAFAECNEKTQVIIIENIENQNQILFCYPMITDGITVNRQMKKPFKINPKLILLSEDLKNENLPKDESFSLRFRVIINE